MLLWQRFKHGFVEINMWACLLRTELPSLPAEDLLSPPLSTVLNPEAQAHRNDNCVKIRLFWQIIPEP